MKAETRPIAIEIPRDREGCFEAKLSRKKNSKTVSLTIRSLSYTARKYPLREITATIKERLQRQHFLIFANHIAAPLINKVRKW